jgi:hypothetical protein
MKKVSGCLILLLLFSSSLTFAQKDKKEKKDYSKEDEKIYNKLANLYTMDNFKKCIEECEKYIKNEKTARSPYPYLYMGMCYLAIYQDQENFDMKKYKDPLRKALGLMGRFKKKDKTGELLKENDDFMRDLRKGVLLETAAMNEKKDYKNLQNLARDVAKNYDKDEAMLIISGVYLDRSDSKIEGERNIETGMNLLKKKKDDGTKFDSDQADLLTQTFTIYSDYLVDSKDVAKAKSTMSFAKELLPDNEKLNKQAEKIDKM